MEKISKLKNAKTQVEVCVIMATIKNGILKDYFKGNSDAMKYANKIDTFNLEYKEYKQDRTFSGKANDLIEYSPPGKFLVRGIDIKQIIEEERDNKKKKLAKICEKLQKALPKGTGKINPILNEAKKRIEEITQDKDKEIEDACESEIAKSITANKGSTLITIKNISTKGVMIVQDSNNGYSVFLDGGSNISKLITNLEKEKALAEKYANKLIYEVNGSYLVDKGGSKLSSKLIKFIKSAGAGKGTKSGKKLTPGIKIEEVKPGDLKILVDGNSLTADLIF